MSFNGSGSFTINSTGQPVVSSTLIEASVFNAFTADIATGLSLCVTRDGQSPATANLPLGGFKLTGVGAATARTDAATLATIQDGTGIYVATVGGTADAITLTPSPTITAYAAGQAFYWIASGANTTAVTLQVSGIASPKAVTKNGTTALVAGDIPSGALVGARYDGTRFQLVNLGAATVPAGAIPYTLIDAAGDWIQGTAADTAARFPAAATVAAHATTCDPWGARTVTLSGSAVTFTDLADADYVGQRVLLLMNAAHVWTDGAVFDVQGGATYTTAAGDWVELVATAVDAFDVTIFPALGQPVSMQPITNSLSGDVALNNTGAYFTGPTVAQGTAGTWFASGTVTLIDTAGAASFNVKLWDGTTIFASSVATGSAVNVVTSVSLSGYIANPAGNIRISVQDATSTSGQILASQAGNTKDSTVTAIRIK